MARLCRVLPFLNGSISQKSRDVAAIVHGDPVHLSGSQHLSLLGHRCLSRTYRVVNGGDGRCLAVRRAPQERRV
ncbi:hypothetical protein [Nonomuraea aurantiaca]|uniref:hypothetical protein n=1 Tax=Nonomuraea aurantiaca TaxID=2878562 RepID=UPI001CDA05D3|nr:hypothetical protein [Nonomuraea aurantiaca]MCA2228800.1 hypothetical protein [Nonomuraea aurantiaca]